MSNWYQDQLTNKNFLSPIGFVFLLDKAKKTSFLCQRASIPELSLGDIAIPTRGFVSVPLEGNIQYSTLNIDFIDVDPQTLNVKAEEVIKKVSKKTKVILKNNLKNHMKVQLK